MSGEHFFGELNIQAIPMEKTGVLIVDGKGRILSDSF